MFPKLGLGTWMMGGRAEPDPNNDDAKDIEAIQNALNAGIKHIDTAKLYANGKAEELVGQAIKGYKREDLLIATKIHRELNYDDVLRNCEASLKRLGLDYIDLYYVHMPMPSIPIKETARAFNKLMERGLIKNIGISDALNETMDEYQANLDYKIFASQNQYSLIAREPQFNNHLEYCKKNNIHFVAWRPIQLPAPAFNIEPMYKRGAYKLLDDMADKYGVKNAQIAVRWLTQQDNVNVVFKTTNPEHLKEIVDSGNITISPEDMKNLADNFPRQEKISFTSSSRQPML
ncbi:MAG: aldo/keto reductase [Lactobacillus sp.]|jgi:diketogulonate reductase-like aldo/keto reductase|nr:aldo/keto reductase [Lactobacillus sp.]